ncbi:hypothetical protein HZS_7395 [Henneguya salminicola]|nr:hypothetical protein HZS_7395 [Henneguya salminicola]
MIPQRIFLPLTIPSDAAHIIIPERYKITGTPTFTLALMEQKTEIMYRRVREKVRENIKLHAKVPCVILRRHLLIHLCFAIRAHH